MGREGDAQRIVQEIKFDHPNKWYMHKLESAQENETRKLLWDFEIQIDLLITAGQSGPVTVKKNPAESWTLPSQ